VYTKHQNALNQRVAKEVNGTITQKYLWSNLTTLLAIYDKDDNLIQRYEYANQRMPIAMTDKDNNRYYLHYDQVESLRAISDKDHNIIKEITYDTYGNIINDTNPDFKVPFGFAGGLYDQDTKLVHFGYREYDSFTGKWTAKDPISFQGGDSNLYGLGPYNCTPKKDPQESAKEAICKKAEETCSDYAQRAFDYCNETQPSPTKSTTCAYVWKEAYDLCNSKIKKIPICKEEKSCEKK